MSKLEFSVPESKEGKDRAVNQSSPEKVTRLLEAWNAGDETALDQLMPLVYRELQWMAHQRMKGEFRDNTLQTTALVHEAYLRLVGQRKVEWRNRAHFYAIAAQVMRRILVDFARRRHAAKRGGGTIQISFHEDKALASTGEIAEVVALDQALTALAALDDRKSKVVEMRFFGGLSIEESAQALGVSAGTVRRDWTLAKAWLQREMDSSSS